MARSSGASVGEPLLREVRFEDLPAIQRLERRTGFSPSPEPYWQQLWENPVFDRARDRWSQGWVLESEGRIVGHFGNVPMLYALGDRTVTAAAARGVEVDPDYQGRGLGSRLMGAFLDQPGVDLLQTTTTNEVAGRLFTRFDFVRIPQQDYDRILYWVLCPRAFARASLRSRRMGALASGVLSAIATPLIGLERAARRREPRRREPGESVDAVDVGEIESEFDEFWERKKNERPALLAFRTAEVLRWHFGRVVEGRSTKIYRYRRSGRLVGYASVIRQEVGRLGLARSRLADLIAENDDPRIFDALLRAIYDGARADGSGVLEVIGFPEPVRARLALGNPYSRATDGWPYFYRVEDRQLRAELEDTSRWYGSPYDGDGSL